MRAIYCAGDLGRTILDSLQRGNGETDVCFIDDDSTLVDTTVDGVPVRGAADVLSKLSPLDVIVGYGADTATRLDLITRVAESSADFFDVVDPAATVSDDAVIGIGVYVNAETYVGPGATLGDHVILDSAVNVSHDTIVREGTILTPGATLAGNVTVEEGGYIGPGATVLKERTIGPGATVGSGAVVTEDVPADATVVGVPAHPISERD